MAVPRKLSPKDYSPRYVHWLLQDAIWLHYRGDKAEAMKMLFEVIENQCFKEKESEQTPTGSDSYKNNHTGG